MDGFPASVAPEVWAVAWIEQRNVGVLGIRTTGEHDKGVVKRDNYIKHALRGGWKAPLGITFAVAFSSRLIIMIQKR